MAKKPGLSLQQHKDLGAELFEIRGRLIKAGVLVANAYTVKMGDRLLRTVDSLDQLRSDLDTKLADEYPGDFDVHIYYPGTR